MQYQARRNWRSFFFILLCGFPSTLLLVMSGHLLPEPFGSYVPHQSRIMRTEQVLRNAMTGGSNCLLFAGDSRVAFQVNSETLSAADCPAKNIGYPGIGAREIVYLVERAVERAGKAETIVLGLPFRLFLEPYAPEMFRTPDFDASFEELLEMNLLTRWFILGRDRLFAMVDSVFGEAPRFNNWTYRDDVGRWEEERLAERSLGATPNADNEIERLAKNYFGNRSITSDFKATLKNMLERLYRSTDRLVILLPPNHPDFVVAGEHLKPGARADYRATVLSVADEMGVSVIDCSEIARCGVSAEMFADPVHLNDEGSIHLTEALGVLLNSRWAAGDD